MSAECERCGHDLAYDLTCELCELRDTIRDAISALGIGTCSAPDCDGCKADAESAREILRSTGLKPSGYEHFDADARRAWDQALAACGPGMEGSRATPILPRLFDDS